MPEVNQIELHPWNQQKECISYCMSEGIALFLEPSKCMVVNIIFLTSNRYCNHGILSPCSNEDARKE